MEFVVQTPLVLPAPNRFSRAFVEPTAVVFRPPGTVLIFRESWAARVRKIPAGFLLQTVFRLHLPVLFRASASLREKWLSVFPARCWLRRSGAKANGMQAMFPGPPARRI